MKILIALGLILIGVITWCLVRVSEEDEEDEEIDESIIEDTDTIDTKQNE